VLVMFTDGLDFKSSVDLRFRAWPRSAAANSTWLNLIGICVGQPL